MTYTILIVEDEYLVRQGLTKLVNVAAYDMEIIGPVSYTHLTLPTILLV